VKGLSPRPSRRNTTISHDWIRIDGSYRLGNPPFCEAPAEGKKRRERGQGVGRDYRCPAEQERILRRARPHVVEDGNTTGEKRTENSSGSGYQKSEKEETPVKSGRKAYATEVKGTDRQ